jgi:integrating conjugative element protein (TIGR03756 family)
MNRLFTALRCLRLALASLLMGSATSTLALVNTATIVTSSLSLACLNYYVVGICYWLTCTPFGCSVNTSVKVRHFIPDAVVSSYSNTGENPWTEVRLMSRPNSSAQAGGDGTTNHKSENNLAKFKNADVIGHPGGSTFAEFASESGYTCAGAGTAYTPYFLSVLDTYAWRYYLPEMFYPEALIPGLREIGSPAMLNLWGAVYPRGGFLHQTDDYKAGAVVAQRAGDIVTRAGQIHVYQPLLASPEPGYWPAGPLLEGQPTTGLWQELYPVLSPACGIFPAYGSGRQAEQGDYAWALWRPYACCQREGQTFITSIDFL